MKPLSTTHDSLFTFNMFYQIGRGLQLIGLLAMPSAMWVAEVQRDEALSIGVFVGAGLVFLLGLFLTQIKR